MFKMEENYYAARIVMLPTHLRKLAKSHYHDDWKDLLIKKVFDQMQPVLSHWAGNWNFCYIGENELSYFDNSNICELGYDFSNAIEDGDLRLAKKIVKEIDKIRYSKK